MIMNKGLLDGFNDIRADKYLLTVTKRKMEEAKPRRQAFPVKKAVFAAFPVLAVAALFLFSYGTGGRRAGLSVKAQDLMAGVRPNHVDVTGAVTDGFTRSVQHFSAELLKHSAQSGQNTLISPVSAYFSLGMAQNGASGTTLDAFHHVLAKYDSDTLAVNKACLAYSRQLAQQRGDTVVQLSDSVWIRAGLGVKSAFLQNNADYFGAGARTLNFSDQNSLNIVNEWVKEHTGGKIDHILDRIDGNDCMYLLNTLYFSAKWQFPFGTQTKSAPYAFQTASGEKQVPFMWLSHQLSYIRAGSATGVLLPYNDSRFALLCILPDSSIDINQYLDTLGDTTLRELLETKTSASVTVGLPKFTAQSDYDFKQPLTAMGLGDAFRQGNADFSKMSGEKLSLSQVRQKTYLRVDELGTEAGAATNSVMQKTAARAQPIIFDRPFLYAVIDTQTEIPLFLGVMQDPQ